MRSIEKIKRLTNDPKNIRNVGLLAHVNHGKTTLADHLLAAGGVIGEKFAGSALFLDYLEEEQKRSITIKTSTISLPIQTQGKEFLINLVDCPGHVDFSGKTSRSLRLMDGCVIIVDALEGIMAQTRSVIRLALKEWVRPILFINKIDRLLTLSFSIEQVQERFEEIISVFNHLINLFGKNKQKKWNVQVDKSQVLFGSALEGWGFSLPQLLDREMKFEEIMYLHEEDKDRLTHEFPLQKLLPQIIYKNLPSPPQAQKYRAKKLWEGGNPPKRVIKCKDGSTTTIYVSKTTPKAGRIFITGRVFSGSVTKGELIQLNSGKKKRIEGLSILRGDKREVVRKINTGGVFGAFLDTKSGTTFSNKRISGYFTSPFHIPVPVIYEAIEPRQSHQFDKLLKELRKKTLEDPNLSVRVSKKSGRILLGGVGELHLELALKDVRDKVELYVSNPKVAYREVLKSGGIARERGLLVRIKPLIDLKESKVIDEEKIGNEIKIEGYPKDMAINLNESLRKGLKSGPKAGAPIVGCLIQIKKKKEKKKSIEESLNAFFNALASSETVLCEPVYQFNALTSTQNLGRIQDEVNRRNGNIESIQTTAGKLVQIKGTIPVRRSIGLASDVRALAHGKVDLQLKFYGYHQLKEKEGITEELSTI